MKRIDMKIGPKMAGFNYSLSPEAGLILLRTISYNSQGRMEETGRGGVYIFVG